MDNPDSKNFPAAADVFIDNEVASDILSDREAMKERPGPAKIGVAGAVFLILNKMIGTGSMALRRHPLVRSGLANSD